uniref:Calpain catalytic domain-containing protein n=1 Tax=Panagrellus redivivus TaxID=6233 RepID=A0A7E4VH61_PANRE
MTDPGAAQPPVRDVVAEADSIVRSLFRLCRQDATLDMSNGNLTPPPLDTSTDTNELLDIAIKTNADPTRLVEIAKKLYNRQRHCDTSIDDRNCWQIPYSVTVTNNSNEASTFDANVGHLAWVPRRPRPAGGHTQFDTRITMGDGDYFQLYDEAYFRGRPDSTAVLVKLFLGLQLAERYGDDDTVKGMVGVIDDSNRPVFTKRYDNRGSDPAWDSYLDGATKKTHHIYAHDSDFDQGLAHCLYLASVEWPFWPDVDFEHNLVPPQLAVKIEGIPGNNVVFVRDRLTKELFGNEVRLPSWNDWCHAIFWFSRYQRAFEECCYAREIAARITFYWPEHAPESRQRDIIDVDAAALATFNNSDLVLPRPLVGLRFVASYDAEIGDPVCYLWEDRMDTVMSMRLDEGIVYDNIIGRSIAYAQGCVNQSHCVPADSLLYRSLHDDGDGSFTPFNRPRSYTFHRSLGKKMSGYERLWYSAGNGIFGFMPSSEGVLLCTEGRSHDRTVWNRHRLVNRLAHRLVSSSQVLDIMAVMPDACYLGIGNIALSNVMTNLHGSTSPIRCNEFRPKFVSTTNFNSLHDPPRTMDHGGARILANFVRCLGTSTESGVNNRPASYRFSYPPQFYGDENPWRRLKVIYDPVFTNWPEEATWTIHDDTDMERRVFTIQNSSIHFASSPWATLISQFHEKPSNESSVPAAGIISCSFFERFSLPPRIPLDFGRSVVAPIVILRQS